MATSLVNNKYRITRRIGGGSFGEIYMGVGPNNEKVAVKFERHGTRCPQLRHEYKVYRELTNCHGFCSVYHFGTQDNYNVMVMDLLGPSLEDLFNKCNRRFSLKTVLQMADQILERVDTLHSRHLIHRDIKPANFVVGIGDQASNVYCVDFGLSKRYRHPKNLQHIPHRDGRSLTGTPRYASINNHLGIEQSRRDDLESVGYVLIYFLKGTLPWQGLKAKNAQKKYRLILEKKQQVSIAQLCQGCPSQFAEFLAYTRSLKFDAKPDIPYLRKLFRDLYHAQGCGAVPKLWDWDGMEMEFPGASEASAVVNTGAPAGQNVGLRPTTAAAVVANGMDPEMLLASGNVAGVGDAGDEEEYGLDAAGNSRPNTAGAMMGAGYRGRQPGKQAANWGYSRQGGDQLPPHQQLPGNTGAVALLKDPHQQMKPTGAVAVEYGPDGQRRPHTAHGARAGMPVEFYGDPNNGQQYAEGDVLEDDAVVAGARGMMRYRRNRATSIEPGQTSSAAMAQQQMQGQAQYGSKNWTGDNGSNPGAMPVYQNAAGAKMTQQQLAAQQQMALRKGGAAAGQQWPGGYDRPKSAGISSTNSGANNSGLMATLSGNGRPSSSTQGMVANNWNGNAQPGAANSNALSFGSMKNRFLSGAAKNNGGTNTTVNSGSNSNASGNGKSKLFSLAR